MKVRSGLSRVLKGRERYRPSMTTKTLHDITKYNTRTFRRRYVAEISGSLGDLGTFLPITIALSINGTISLSSTLVFSGLFNIFTGLIFGIPLPVQPMKAVAAVAIARSSSFTSGDLAAAGLFVAACILAFSLTGLLRSFSKAIPIPVVKGIQVGAGLSLIISSAAGLLSSLHWTGPSWADNRVWAVVAFLLLLITTTSAGHWKIPYALVVFILGMVFAVIRWNIEGDDHHHQLPLLQVWIPSLIIPHGHDWRKGSLDAGIGQVPLTTLNSIIAVVHLAADLFPSHVVHTPSITSIGLSVAGMNLLGCWFGAMPVCHGSGGLAAQYRFGARSGASVVFLGLVKLVLGLFFGERLLLALLERFPSSLLGIMVLAAGLELASVGESLNTFRARDITGEDGGSGGGDRISEEERKKRWAVMMTTMGFLVGFKNDAVGFVAGMLCHWIYSWPPRVDWQRVRGQLMNRQRRIRL